MKKVILLLCLLSVFTSQAQQSTSEPTPSTTSSTKMSLSKITHRQDGLVVNFTSDGWLEIPSSITNKPFSSRGFSFYFLVPRMNKQETFGIAYGIGLSSQNFSSDAYFNDVTNPAKTYIHPLPDSVDYDINKLSLNYLDLALEFRIHSKENESHKRFKLSLGVKGGWLFQDHTKYKDEDMKSKSYNLDHLNAFQYGLTARIGYSKLGVNGYYALSGIFEKDKGPDLVPFSIGISFTP